MILRSSAVSAVSKIRGDLSSNPSLYRSLCHFKLDIDSGFESLLSWHFHSI